MYDVGCCSCRYNPGFVVAYIIGCCCCKYNSGCCYRYNRGCCCCWYNHGCGCRYDRDWRYHKEEHVWITRVPSVEASVKTNTFERGTYYFFDAQNWVKVPKDFHLEYDKLEERPHLPQMPPTLHHAGTTGAGTAPTGQPTPVMSH